MKNQPMLREESGRLYLGGNTYPLRGEIKAMGGRWDAERKTWWVAVDRRADAERLLTQQPAAAYRPGLDAVVAGRVTHMTREFYLAGKPAADGGVTPVISLAGSKRLIYTLDGSAELWVGIYLTSVTELYPAPRTIRDGLCSKGACPGCGQCEAVTTATDANGLVASVCETCAALPRPRRLFS